MFHKPHSQPTKRHLWILRISLAYGSFSLSFPVINLFWQQRGLDQAQIGYSQAVFTLIVMLSNVWTGRWADKHGRAKSMVLGTSLTALGFLGYAFAWDFWSVVFWEAFIGVGASFIGGANTGLQRAYCEHLGRNIGHERAITSGFGNFASLIVYPAASLLGASHPAPLVFVEGLIYGLLALMLLQLPEFGRSAPRDSKTLDVLRDIASDARLRWRILTMAFSRELTHAPIWVFTPLMLAFGLPGALIGFGWAVQSATETVMSFVAHRLVGRLRPIPALAISVTPTVLVSLLALVWHDWPAVVLLIAGFGVTRSLTGALIMPLVTEAAHPDHVSTTESVAGTLARFVYMGAVTVTGIAATANPLRAISVNLAIFVLPLMIAGFMLARTERPKPRHRR